MRGVSIGGKRINCVSKFCGRHGDPNRGKHSEDQGDDGKTGNKKIIIVIVK